MPKEHAIDDRSCKTARRRATTGHNRWHEPVPPAVEVEPGETVVYETRDAFDGQLDAQSTDVDVLSARLGPVHPLTGPV